MAEFNGSYLIDMLFHVIRGHKTTDPDELMYLIEDSLTVDESKVARMVLKKAHSEGTTDTTELMKLMQTTIKDFREGRTHA